MLSMGILFSIMVKKWFTVVCFYDLQFAIYNTPPPPTMRMYSFLPSNVERMG